VYVILLLGDSCSSHQETFRYYLTSRFNRLFTKTRHWTLSSHR